VSLALIQRVKTLEGRVDEVEKSQSSAQAKAEVTEDVSSLCARVKQLENELRMLKARMAKKPKE